MQRSKASPNDALGRTRDYGSIVHAGSRRIYIIINSNAGCDCLKIEAQEMEPREAAVCVRGMSISNDCSMSKRGSIEDTARPQAHGQGGQRSLRSLPESASPILCEGGLHEHKDSTNRSLRNPPCLGPRNQNVGSLCLCALSGPYIRKQVEGGQNNNVLPKKALDPALL